MAGSVNKVILIGNLGKDPEIRRTQDGRPIANLRIATSDTWRDKATGERREKTEWHSVVIFNENLCKIAEQYLKKGSKVFIEGSLQTRKWQGQDGQDRYSTEVVLQGFNGNLTMLDGRSGGAARACGGRPGRLRRRNYGWGAIAMRRAAARAAPSQGRLRQAARRRDPVLRDAACLARSLAARSSASLTRFLALRLGAGAAPCRLATFAFAPLSPSCRCRCLMGRDRLRLDEEAAHLRDIAP